MYLFIYFIFLETIEIISKEIKEIQTRANKQ